MMRSKGAFVTMKLWVMIIVRDNGFQLWRWTGELEARTKDTSQRGAMKRTENALSSHNLIVSANKAIECRVPLSA